MIRAKESPHAPGLEVVDASRRTRIMPQANPVLKDFLTFAIRQMDEDGRYYERAARAVGRGDRLGLFLALSDVKRAAVRKLRLFQRQGLPRFHEFASRMPPASGGAGAVPAVPGEEDAPGDIYVTSMKREHRLLELFEKLHSLEEDEQTRILFRYLAGEIRGHIRVIQKARAVLRDVEKQWENRPPRPVGAALPASGVTG